MADDVTLSSPVAFVPKRGKAEVTALLGDVFASISNYRITRTWIDGEEILLEFDANAGKMSLQGIDRISLDPDGKMTHVKVFIRPFRGLLAVMTSVADRQIARMSLLERVLARAQIAIRRWF